MQGVQLVGLQIECPQVSETVECAGMECNQGVRPKIESLEAWRVRRMRSLRSVDSRFAQRSSLFSPPRPSKARAGNAVRRLSPNPNRSSWERSAKTPGGIAVIWFWSMNSSVRLTRPSKSSLESDSMAFWRRSSIPSMAARCSRRNLSTIVNSGQLAEDRLPDRLGAGTDALRKGWRWDGQHEARRGDGWVTDAASVAGGGSSFLS